MDKKGVEFQLCNYLEAHLRQAEGRGPKARERAKRARERSEQHSSEVYSSRSEHLPEAPTCIHQKCTFLGVYSFLSDHLP